MMTSRRGTVGAESRREKVFFKFVFGVFNFDFFGKCRNDQDGPSDKLK